MNNEKALRGQVAAITGATRGLGRAIAQRVAAEGANLVLNARTAQDLESFKGALTEEHPDIRVATVPGTVGDSSIAEALVDCAIDSFGRLDILVNNAAIPGKTAILRDTSIADIDDTIDVNLKGPIYLMKFALPELSASGGGTIINVNSVAGKTAFPMWSAYSAAKFGLRAVTEIVGEEHRSDNIKVVGLYPGAINTSIWDFIDLSDQASRDKMLSVADVADLVAFLVTQPRNVYIREVGLTPQNRAV